MVDNKQVNDRQSVMLISYFCICEIVEIKFMVNSVIYMLRLNASRYSVRGYVERDFQCNVAAEARVERWFVVSLSLFLSQNEDSC